MQGQVATPTQAQQEQQEQSNGRREIRPGEANQTCPVENRKDGKGKKIELKGKGKSQARQGKGIGTPTAEACHSCEKAGHNVIAGVSVVVQHIRIRSKIVRLPEGKARRSRRSTGRR